MELQTLRCFLTAAQAGSLRKGAGILNISPARLSYQVKRLEAELDTNLFYRSYRLRLTPEGELLKKKAEEIIKLADKDLLEYPFFFSSRKAWDLLVHRDLSD
jgi:DNA-binding transcriptional LysR family regulator